MSTRIEGDTHFTDDVRMTGTLTVPAGSFNNADIAASADIDADKIEHRHVITYWQDDGTDVASAIAPVYVVTGTTATINSVEVICLDAPEGGDKTFTVDLLECIAGDATPATVLSTVITYPAATADCTVRPGTISSASLADGQILVVQVAASGSTGNQGQGVCVVITIDEDAA